MSRAARIGALILVLAAGACVDRGREGRTGPARRVVSLIPSATETIIALGAADRLVARTDFDSDPSLSDLPSLGGGLTPSIEAVAMLEPDLVVAWPDNMSRSVTAQLADLGVDVYSPAIQNLDDIYASTRELGRRLGLAAAADSLVRSLRGELAATGVRVAGRERPGVIYLVWHDPPTTVGPGTFMNELIEIAGGRNLFADAPSMWPQVSLEEVVRRQPELIVIPAGEDRSLSLEQLRTAVGWRDLAAVREGRVAEVDAELFNRPGPRVADAARALARILHPDPTEVR